MFGARFGNRPAKTPSDPFTLALNGYNFTHGLLVRDANRWRNAFLTVVPALAISLVLVIVVGQWLLHEAIQTGGNHLYLVPVDKQQRVVGTATEIPASQTLTPVQGDMIDKATTFVESAFSAFMDPTANKTHVLGPAYDLASGAGTTFLDQYYKQQQGKFSPFVIGSRGISQVAHVQSMQPPAPGGSIFTAVWTETQQSVVDGTVPQPDITCSAALQLATSVGARSSDAFIHNPFGIRVLAVTPVIGGQNDARCGLGGSQ